MSIINRKKKTSMKTAIVVAFRKEETDLAATVESAVKSAGEGVKVIQVEDKDASGPGRNRDRGIMAADDADVIIIIDAHMRFQGTALQDIARQVRENGGLLTPICHHNEQMDFNVAPYTGAYINWTSSDHTPQFSPLAAKWCKNPEPGKRNAVMGACYAFRRQWYMDAGRPLAMLAGWGGDEEALSIAAWICGEEIRVIESHVAHLYRARQPWAVPSMTPIILSRAALVNAFVIEHVARGELMHHLRKNNVPMPDKHPLQAEIDRVKTSMLKQRRSFEDWRTEACGREDVEPGSERKKPKVQNPIVTRKAIECPHCGSQHDHNLKVENTYQNGQRRRHICPVCHLPFQTVSQVFTPQVVAIGM